MPALSPQGSALLQILVRHLNRHERSPTPDVPETLIGYRETLDELNLPPSAPRGDTDGKTLQLNGLNDLAKWVKKIRGMPRITGLVVSRSTKDEDDGSQRLKNVPGKGYFKEYNRHPEDWTWWGLEMTRCKEFDWSRYVTPIPVDKISEEPPGPATSPTIITLPNQNSEEDQRLLEAQGEGDSAVHAAPETQRMALLLSRIGQGEFRRQVIGLRGCCHVSGVSDHRFLRASHIKPWRESSNLERLDPHNGLLLTPTFDHLFDRFLISFTDEGRMIVSAAIDKSLIEALSIKASNKALPFPLRTLPYLRHHRQKFEQEIRR